MEPARRVFRNACIRTLNPAHPTATTLVVDRGRIAWVGAGDPPPYQTDKRTTEEDLRGAPVLPGFVDPHCHPLALGRARLKIDCSPETVSTIRELVDVLRKGRTTGADRWIRAFGYDELRLAERRHPTRHDLDEAATDRPVCLEHSSGHALVLNTRGLREVGIHAGSSEPEGGTIDRDPATGEPTGLLLEMNDFVSARMSRHPRDDARKVAKSASDALLEAGVTSVTDAGFRNSANKLDLYAHWRLGGDFQPRVTVMLEPGAWPIRTATASGVRVGCAKLRFTVSSGDVRPTVEEAVTRAKSALAHGAPGLAIHAVEPGCIAAAIEAIQQVGNAARTRRRVEHASECEPGLAQRLVRVGATIVTQPGFLRTRGDRYLNAPDLDVSSLYPLRRWWRLGARVAGSSDAPFGPVNPFVGISAAITRRAHSGRTVGRGEGLELHDALALFGPNAAEAAALHRDAGSLTVGAFADFVVLDADPTRVSASEVAQIRVLRTVIGGETVWTRE